MNALNRGHIEATTASWLQANCPKEAQEAKEPPGSSGGKENDKFQPRRGPARKPKGREHTTDGLSNELKRNNPNRKEHRGKMKPEGNRVGNWTGRNARSQGLIGSEEKAKADSAGGLLPERSLWGERAAWEFRREGE